MNEFFKRYAELGETPKEVELLPTIRINTLKTTPEIIHPILQKKKVKLKKIPNLPDAFTVVDSPFSLGASVEYLMGYISLQEQAAQYAVEVLDPKKDETVLDMCAAPGNKTTQIAAKMQDFGTIIALEPIGYRMKVLFNYLERCGVANTTVYNMDGRMIDDLNTEFDRVLVDAPCSGNFVIDKKWLETRDLEGVRAKARLQKQLLVAAVNVLKTGGTLVYSTCSLEPEENELMIAWLIDEFPEMKLEDTGLDLGDPGLTDVFGQKLDKEIKKTRRLWPWKTQTQGFYIAKLVKC